MASPSSENHGRRWGVMGLVTGAHSAESVRAPGDDGATYVNCITPMYMVLNITGMECRQDGGEQGVRGAQECNESLSVRGDNVQSSSTGWQTIYV